MTLKKKETIKTLAIQAKYVGSSDLALLTFLQIKPFHQVIIVYITTKTKTTRGLKPRRNIAHQNCRDNQWPVCIAQLVAEQNECETQRSQSQTNGPCKTLRPCRLPMRLRMSHFHRSFFSLHSKDVLLVCF